MAVNIDALKTRIRRESLAGRIHNIAKFEEYVNNLEDYLYYFAETAGYAQSQIHLMKAISTGVEYESIVFSGLKNRFLKYLKESSHILKKEVYNQARTIRSSEEQDQLLETALSRAMPTTLAVGDDELSFKTASETKIPSNLYQELAGQKAMELGDQWIKMSWSSKLIYYIESAFKIGGGFVKNSVELSVLIAFSITQIIFRNSINLIAEIFYSSYNTLRSQLTYMQIYEGGALLLILFTYMVPYIGIVIKTGFHLIFNLGIIMI